MGNKPAFEAQTHFSAPIPSKESNDGQTTPASRLSESGRSINASAPVSATAPPAVLPEEPRVNAPPENIVRHSTMDNCASMPIQNAPARSPSSNERHLEALPFF